jgi:hypothetical protein
VVLDLAPLRSSSLAWAVDTSLSLAEAAGARRIEPAERPLHAVPFDTIPVDLPLSVEQVSSQQSGAGAVGFRLDCGSAGMCPKAGICGGQWFIYSS